MKRTTLIVAMCALLFAGHAIAQSNADADPLTGTWSGTMGPSETRQQPIKVELKYDAKTPVVLEGNLVKGTASGSISFNNNTGTFTITKDASAK